MVFLEKIHLVGYTLISSVLFHLSTSLVWYTPYRIVILIYLLTFQNSIMTLLSLRKFCLKIAYPQKLIFIRYNSHTIFSLIPTFFMPLRNISFDPLTYKPKLFSSDLKHISKPIKPLSPCFCFKYSRSMSVFGCRAPYIVKVFLVFLYPFFSTHLHSSSI